MGITAQEAWTDRGTRTICIPAFVREVVERIAFEAREDPRVDKRSGVSQRVPISVLESAVSNAERRALLCGEDRVVPRIGDIYAAIPAITGKLELEYEGELQGRETVAHDLVVRAAGATFDQYFDEEMTGPIVAYFDGGGALQVSDTASAKACLKGFESVPSLLEVARDGGRVVESQPEVWVAAAELVLEGLVAKRRISRTEAGQYRARRERPRGPGGLAGPGGLGGQPYPKPPRPYGGPGGGDLLS